MLSTCCRMIALLYWLCTVDIQLLISCMPMLFTYRMECLLCCIWVLKWSSYSATQVHYLSLLSSADLWYSRELCHLSAFSDQISALICDHNTFPVKFIWQLLSTLGQVLFVNLPSSSVAGGLEHGPCGFLNIIKSSCQSVFRLIVFCQDPTEPLHERQTYSPSPLGCPWNGRNPYVGHRWLEA